MYNGGMKPWNKRTDIKKEEVIRLYCEEKLSLRTCAKRLECDRTVIKRILLENNKKIRNISEEKKLHPTSYWKGKKREGVWNKGKRAKEDPRILSGERNGFWKGGKLKDQKDRKSSDMKLWRLEVYERDDFTCQMCGERGGKLEAHHINPYTDYPDLRFEVTNGITLCRECHRSIKRKEYQFIQVFKEILEKGVNSVKVQNG